MTTEFLGLDRFNKKIIGKGRWERGVGDVNNLLSFIRVLLTSSFFLSKVIQFINKVENILFWVAKILTKVVHCLFEVRKCINKVANILFKVTRMLITVACFLLKVV
jgi:hypothetical protein